MEFDEKDNKLTIRIVSDGARKSLQGFKDADEIDTDKAMFDFFDDVLSHYGWEWIDAEEIGVLTSAPIIGMKNENEQVIKAYGFMDYALRSLLGDLYDYGEAVLIKG